MKNLEEVKGNPPAPADHAKSPPSVSGKGHKNRDTELISP